MSYDIAVIGNDEAAFEMSCLAAGSGKRTLAVLPETQHSEWLVAQALRRLISTLLVDHSTQRQQMFARKATPRLLHALITRAVAHEVRTQISSLETLGVDVVTGEAHFCSARTLAVAGAEADVLRAGHIVIGTGVRRTAMHRPLGLRPFHRPETLLTGRHLPGSVCIVGGNDFGTGLGALISLFGVQTRIVARRDNTSVMLELASAAGVHIGHHPADVGLSHLDCQDPEPGSAIVDCRRSIGFTDRLNLYVINVEPDENGKLWCASNFETWCTGVFGIGDVVGFSPDTKLHPTVQAERIMNRILHSVPRPHLLQAPVRKSAFA